MARMKPALVAAITLIVTLGGSLAAAQQPPTPLENSENSDSPALDTKPEKRLTVSVSPLHLMAPVAEVTGEYAVSEDFGVAGIAGVGGRDGAYMLGFGAQAIWYATGDFQQGFQVGGELIYNEVGASWRGHSVALLGGLGLAPFVGYKVSSVEGFTGIIQAGPQFISGANAFGGSGAATAFMLNLNVGWTS